MTVCEPFCCVRWTDVNFYVDVHGLHMDEII